MNGYRKLGFTAYGKVGTDGVRVSLAQKIDTGEIVYVKEDGTNAVLPTRPTRFITCSTVGNVASALGYAVNMSALPWDVIATTHEWKRGVTLAELAGRESYLGWDKAKIASVKASLKAAYADMFDEDAEAIAA